MTSIDSNLPRARGPTIMVYASGAQKYRERCDEVAANGYDGFALR